MTFLIYNETYHVNKGVIVSISNTASIITLELLKSDNNNNNNILIYITNVSFHLHFPTLH